MEESRAAEKARRAEGSLDSDRLRSQSKFTQVSVRVRQRFTLSDTYDAVRALVTMLYQHSNGPDATLDGAI